MDPIGIAFICIFGYFIIWFAVVCLVGIIMFPRLNPDEAKFLTFVWPVALPILFGIWVYIKFDKIKRGLG